MRSRRCPKNSLVNQPIYCWWWAGAMASVFVAAPASGAPRAALHISGDDRACPTPAQVASVLAPLLRGTKNFQRTRIVGPGGCLGFRPRFQVPRRDRRPRAGVQRFGTRLHRASSTSGGVRRPGARFRLSLPIELPSKLHRRNRLRSSRLLVHARAPTWISSSGRSFNPRPPPPSEVRRSPAVSRRARGGARAFIFRAAPGSRQDRSTSRMSMLELGGFRSMSLQASPTGRPRSRSRAISVPL